jgi:hypothetical protein
MNSNNNVSLGKCHCCPNFLQPVPEEGVLVRYSHQFPSEPLWRRIVRLASDGTDYQFSWQNMLPSVYTFPSFSSLAKLRTQNLL